MAKILGIIRDKCEGRAHSEEDLAWLIGNLATIPDYQLASWLMAVVCRGMTPAETTALTRLMADSGEVLDLSDVPGPRVDKHSTGGVGDKVTLVLGPLVAAAGATVAKLSGRGLGHTGGTIDKLEAIPGLRTSLSTEEFKSQLRRTGVAVVGQTAKLAPADGILYALRDVTGTVESIPLIAASVLSKKIAAGADVILIDVKVGSGAFMKTDADAKALSDALLEVGRRLGKKVVCVVSDMGQPLGQAVGHANEVAEAIATLKGEGPADLTELSLRLGSLLLSAGGLASTPEAGVARLEQAIKDGTAIAKFREMIEAQGGDGTVVDRPEIMPQPRLRVPVESPVSGIVSDLDAMGVGLAAKELGAGRLVKGEMIDLAVGITLCAKVGDRVNRGDTLAYLLINDETKAGPAADALIRAYRIGDSPATPPAIIKAVYTQDTATV